MSWKNKIIFVSAQPDVPYFHWQCEVYLNNFIELGIKPENIFVLFGLVNKATELSVKGEAGIVGIRLIFKSNGKGPLARRKGLGLTWLDQISLVPWTIEKNDQGTQTTIEP